MTSGNKTPRLAAAQTEFNIGKDTLIEFLKTKGFEVADKPTTKLTEEMYDALQKQYAQQKAAKQKSDEIALPKGSFLDNLNKSPEELDLSAKDKKAKVTKVATKSEEKPVAAEVKTVVDEVVVTPKEEVKTQEPAPAPKEVAPVTVVDTPVAKEEKEESKKTTDSVEPKESTVVPDATIEKTAAPTAPSENNAVASKDPIVEVKDNTSNNDTTPTQTQFSVVGKINLDELNLNTRPKKGNEKVKPAPQPQQNADKKRFDDQKKKDQPKFDAKRKEQKPEGNQDKPKPQAPSKPAPQKLKEYETIKQVTFDAPAPAEKKEHIDLNAPKLEGPKILGKIELPVGTVGGRQERKEKRKRKRIPVEGKPNTGTNTGIGNNNTPSTGNNNANRDQRNNNYNRNNDQRPGGGNNQNRGTAGGNNNNNNRNNNSNDRNRPNNNNPKRNFTPRDQQPQEIDAKEIQDKIRETQAKLAGGNQKGKNMKAKYRRNKREEMAEKRAASEMENDGTKLQVTEFISVSEFASLLDVSFTDVISKCMGLGIMVSINQRLDAEVIELVASEFDREVEFINLDEKEEEIVIVDADEDLMERAPVVTIMGHVDHGKTSLLDYIRNATVVAGEAGGITQHIGAYKVKTPNGKEIAFLDTPGHEAFTAMRARGAKAADVAVIVVAADDAIMPQTKEAISHAQAAGLPMIFAINKIDKEASNPEKIKEQLAAMNILVEDWGGTFQSQEISAKKGLNIDLLLEKILLEAEMLELKANPNRVADGSVIEASLDKGRGYVSTILVQGGTLHQGDMLVSGQFYGKVKAMFNERGQKVTKAGPSSPVQVLGLNGAPQAGEKIKVYADETEAKNVANHRAQIMREQGLRTRKHITLDEIGRRLALGNFKELNVIIRADVDGSAEALSDSLQKLSTDEVVVNVVHKGVGQISEGDVNLASASDAIILGFQVRPSVQAARLADQENIEIRYYSVIYDAIGEIKSAMEGLLEPTIEKKIVGNIEVRETFKISGVGTIAGCYVLDGKFTRNTKINIIRDGIVVHTGELSSLKRFKDDVKEVNAGYECGLTIKNYNDIQVADIIEGYEEVEVKRKL